MKSFNDIAVEILVAFCVYFTIFVAISYVWQGLEWLYYGEILPNNADTVIGTLFAYSIFKNLRVEFEVKHHA